MGQQSFRKLIGLFCQLLVICLAGTGCHSLGRREDPIPSEIPRELAKISLPVYVIEPPDILLIEAVRTVPLAPYRIEALDLLLIHVGDVMPDEPIAGMYGVGPAGTVALGLSYGSVPLVGLTLEEAQAAIEHHLRRLGLRAPKVAVSLVESRGVQQIRGEHLVCPDGTVGLGIYGSVYVTGLALPQAKAAIEAHLSQFLFRPEISLDVLAFNSKVYYVIVDGGGAGQQVIRMPVTGNETVLDAIAQVEGLPAVSSKDDIWIARPGPASSDCYQILPVNWNEIAECGATATNYQVLPGDRIYVKADHWVAFDNCVAKVVSPFERMFGFTLLGNATVRAVQGGGGAAGIVTGF